MNLWAADARLRGDLLAAAKATIIAHHYTRVFPSGKSWVYGVGSTLVVFSIPPNPYVSRWLVGEPNRVLELSRLWAPDGHGPNDLTVAISHATRLIHTDEPGTLALISYADPNQGHHGGVYRAASWVYLGTSEESRRYVNAEGVAIARRAFHSGGRHFSPAEIAAAGWTQQRAAGKVRFARGLTRAGRAAVNRKAAELRSDAT